jgi:hypothetical protein
MGLQNKKPAGVNRRAFRIRFFLKLLALGRRRLRTAALGNRGCHSFGGALARLGMTATLRLPDCIHSTGTHQTLL